jgi:hypothetical protein
LLLLLTALDRSAASAGCANAGSYASGDDDVRPDIATSAAAVDRRQREPGSER